MHSYLTEKAILKVRVHVILQKNYNPVSGTIVAMQKYFSIYLFIKFAHWNHSSVASRIQKELRLFRVIQVVGKTSYAIRESLLIHYRLNLEKLSTFTSFCF